jgi:hypothetical protein
MSNLKQLAKEILNKTYLSDNIKPILDPLMAELVA